MATIDSNRLKMSLVSGAALAVTALLAKKFWLSRQKPDYGKLSRQPFIEIEW